MKLSKQHILRTFSSLKLFSNNKINRDAVRCAYLTDARVKDLSHVEVSNVNESIIKEKLSAHSVPFDDGYTCIQVKNCCFCTLNKKANNTPSVDIYINKRTGYFICEKCKITGSWCSFNELINKSKLPKGKSSLESFKKACLKIDQEPDDWNDVVNNTTLLHSLEGNEYLEIFKSFKLPFCSKYNIQNLVVRVNKERNTLYFPLICSEGSVVGYKTYDLRGKSITYPKNDCPGFLLHSNPKKPVVVVADIPDFLEVMSKNVNYQILCLPYGTVNLPQSTLPFLESFDKLILWLGGSGSSDMSVQFASKLGDRRCYIVRPNENQASPVIASSKNENFSLILANSKPAWHEYVITFESLREEVLAELQNKERVAGVQWKRFPSLNSILSGHRRGEMTVITGPTGSGKTTFMSEYSLDLAMQGVNTLWGSFEVNNTRLAKTMLTQYAGMSLADNIKDFDAFADKFEQLPIFFLMFHGQQKIPSVMDAIEHCFYTYDIAHVIIDNIQFMIEVTPDYQMERFWKQDYLIQSFRNFATKNNCHVTLVMHPRKEENDSELGLNSIFGGAKATQEADNVFILQSKRVSMSHSKKFLQVSKNRFSGNLGAVPLDFDKKSLCFKEWKPQTFKNVENDEFSKIIAPKRDRFERRKLQVDDNLYPNYIHKPMELM